MNTSYEARGEATNTGEVTYGDGWIIRRHANQGLSCHILEQQIIVGPDEDAQEVAKSLVQCKSQATFLRVEDRPGEGWPWAIYRGSRHELAAIVGKAKGSAIGRPRHEG